MFQRFKSGFTLIELIIVIAIIAIIVSAVFVAIDPVKRLNDARESTAKQDAKNIGKAIELYLADGNSIPSTAFTPNTSSPTGTYSICPSSATVGCGANTLDPDFLVPGYLPGVNHAPSIPESSPTTGYQVSYTNGALNGVTAPAIGSTPTTITAHQPISNFNSLWSSNIYTGINDGVTQPAVPPGGGQIASTNSDNPDHQMYNMGNPNRTATNVTVWLYGRCNAGSTLAVDVTVAGVQTAPQSVPITNTNAWYSVSFNGSWSAANFTSGFQVGFQSNVPTGGINLCVIEAMYADVTG